MTQYTDDFERPNGPLGTDWALPSWEADTWSIVNGSEALASSASVTYWNGPGAWGHEQYSEITVHGAGLTQARDSGPAVLVSDGGAYFVEIRNDNGAAEFMKVNSVGSQTQLGAGLGSAQTGGALSLGDRIGLKSESDGAGGTRLTLYINDAAIAVRTDSSSPHTSGRPGMYGGAWGGHEIDLWSGEDYAAGDTTAPVLTNAAASGSGGDSIAASVDTDEGNGTLAWVATTSATTPSVAQIQAGEDDGGVAAAASGSQAVGSTGTQNVTVTGLAEATTYYVHFVQADAAGNDSTPVTSPAAATADVTAPTFTSGPIASAASETTLEVDATINEAGTVYAVVLADGSSAPSAAQVKAGQDAGGGAALASASSAASAGVGVTLSLTGLTGNTDYDVYVLAEDDESTPNVQATATLTEVKTLGAPNLSNPSAVATGQTTADLSVNTDQDAGTLYWVLTQSVTAPSVSQVQAGQDHTGAAAVAAGNQPVTAAGTQNASASGLVDQTTYYAHFQHSITA